MLRRNMSALSLKLRLSLEDLLAELWHARRAGDLGRLAWVSYYEVRRWARLAGARGLAEHSAVVVTGCPYADRASFLGEVDSLIAELEQTLASDHGAAGDAHEVPSSGEPAPGSGTRPAESERSQARH
jgi:hypothetical protein